MLEDSMLGKKTVYPDTYSPDWLDPIPRKLARNKIDISGNIPFEGIDIWNGYELSWLNGKGKPEISLGVFQFDCRSDNVIESKSFKLYLNSLNQTVFNSFNDVQKTLEKDLTDASNGSVSVTLYSPTDKKIIHTGDFSGTCLDQLDIQTDTYHVHPKFLKTHPHIIKESLYSNLLKSNCLATGQPDWGSVLIHYQGKQIDHEGLLKYIISLRNHSGFAEHCVEQIYCDLMRECQPEKLTVYARYTRRGGLDINPFRSNFEKSPDNTRQIRQ